MSVYTIRIESDTGGATMTCHADTAGEAIRQAANTYGDPGYTFTVIPKPTAQSSDLQHYAGSQHAYYRAAVNAGMVIEPK